MSKEEETLDLDGSSSWIGPPIDSEEPGRVVYRAFEQDGVRYDLGDHVYLSPAEPDIPPYIGKLDSVHEEEDGSTWATVRWYYRPAELEVDSELTFDDGEIFYTDEFATHTLDSVSGKCRVRTPAQKGVEEQAGEGGGEDSYVCSRKYIVKERRVVPLDDGMSGVTLQQALQEKPFTMVEGHVVPRPSHRPGAPSTKRSRPSPPPPADASPSAGSAESQGPPDSSLPGAQHVPPKRRRKQRQEGGQPAASPTGVPGRDASPPTSAAEPATAGAAAAADSSAPRGKQAPLKVRLPTPRPAALAADLAPQSAAQGGTPRGSKRTSTPRASDHPPLSTDTASAGRTEEGGGPRAAGGEHGRHTGELAAVRAVRRWSRERYENAQRSLVGIMQSLQATSADRAILRPALREAARKLIGDTGLLDHLLKHLTDQVVSPSGDRLRRRHNKEGHMEYWMQSPAAAEAEEEMLREEMGALCSELRDLKEARHLLHAVREEAHQAIHAVSAAKDRPEEATQKLTLPPPGSPVGGLLTPSVSGGSAGAGALAPADVALRLDRQTGQLASRLEDARSMAVAGLEEVRREGADVAATMGAHISALAELAHGLIRRCASLEGQLAAVCEEGRGRYEALADLVLQIGEVRGVVTDRDDRIRSLESEVARLGAAIAGSAAPPPSGGQQPVTPMVADGSGQQAKHAQQGSRHLTPHALHPRRPSPEDDGGERAEGAQHAQQQREQVAGGEEEAAHGMHEGRREQPSGPRRSASASLDTLLAAQQQEGTSGGGGASLKVPSGKEQGRRGEGGPSPGARPPLGWEMEDVKEEGRGGGGQLPGSFTGLLLDPPIEMPPDVRLAGAGGGEGEGTSTPLPLSTPFVTQGKGDMAGQSQQAQQQALPPRHPTPPTSRRAPSPGLSRSGSLQAQQAKEVQGGAPPLITPQMLQQAQQAQQARQAPHMLPPGVTPQQPQQLLVSAAMGGMVPGGGALMLPQQGGGQTGIFHPALMHPGVFQDPSHPGQLFFLHPGMMGVGTGGGVGAEAGGRPPPSSRALLPTTITQGPPTIKLEQPSPTHIHKVKLGRGGVAVQGRGTPTPLKQVAPGPPSSSCQPPPLPEGQLIFDPPGHEAAVAEVDMAHACNEIAARGVASNVAGFGGAQQGKGGAKGDIE